MSTALCGCGTSSSSSSSSSPASTASSLLTTKDGSFAVADVAYKLVDTSFVYPITPSTIMAERMESTASAGQVKNIFGRVPVVRQLQSEKGAAAAMHGALVNCSLTTAFTCSQGLLLMIPNMYHMAGECLPGVLHVPTRSVGSQTASLFPDHTDLYACRATNFAILGSASVQEAQDMAAIAHCAAMKLLVPFMHFMDGWRTSHEVQKIQSLTDEMLKQLFPWKEFHEWVSKASPSNEEPRYRNPVVHYEVGWHAAEASAGRYAKCPEVLEALFDTFNTLTGRRYHIFEYYGCAEPESVIVLMGSATKTGEEVVDYLNGSGSKVGLVRCRLFRPFSAKHFAAVLPPSVKRIAVLDRSREIAAGDPLFLDVLASLHKEGIIANRTIIGGRYGVGGLDITPHQLIAVFNHLATTNPRTGFCVGINDDVSGTSIPVPTLPLSTVAPGTTEALFWGLGADGTVGACRQACTIIGENSPYYPQVFFDYDAKKSGGLTVSHMRFGSAPIKSCYLVKRANYIACHSQMYLTRYAEIMIEGIKDGGIFLVNMRFPDEKGALEAANTAFPPSVKKILAERHAQVYLINAYKVATDNHLGKRINFILLSCFFKLITIIPFEKALALLQESVVGLYKKQGPVVIKNNCDAMTQAATGLVKLTIPEEWAKINVAPAELDLSRYPHGEEYKKMVLHSYKHEAIEKAPPVSTFTEVSDGRWPFGFTKLEKRTCAEKVPWWDHTGCIQCNFCSSVCPHASIRPVVIDSKTAKKPDSFTTVPLKGVKKEGEELEFRIQVSPQDCMGCSTCVDVCPKHVLHMKDVEEMVKTESDNWDFAIENEQHTESIASLCPANLIRTSQFNTPMLEFSAACAGCQETPITKLLVQLFGKNMFLSLAVGCCIVWGGYITNIGFTPLADGKGLTIASSLFEDIAEFSLGWVISTLNRREALRKAIEQLASATGITEELKKCIANWQASFDDYQKSAEAADLLRPMLLTSPQPTADYQTIVQNISLLGKKTMWVVGGDGWAYDIDYDGVDHVLASGINVHMLILDNENYGNTGGQFSSATSRGAVTKNLSLGKKLKKKDLGMMMINHRDIYVAYTCIAANPTQSLNALQEANAFPGASVVIAYCPCTNHGWNGELSSPMFHSKYTVESGMCNLYRYNPLKFAEGKNPLTIDSKAPNTDLLDKVLDAENRFATMKRSNPQVFTEFRAALIEDIKMQRERLEKLQASLEPVAKKQ